MQKIFSNYSYLLNDNFYNKTLPIKYNFNSQIIDFLEESLTAFDSSKTVSKILDDAHTSILNVIISCIFRTVFLKQITNIAPWLKTLIHDLYAEDSLQLTNKEIAQKTGYSYVHLEREFKKHMNMNLSSYIAKIKTEKAINLLKTEKYSIEQISTMLGYSSTNGFIKSFKKNMNATPKQYQISMKK